MPTVQESIRVDVPVRAAYNQWTQFEEFPEFMEGVDSIEQRSPAMTHWVTKFGGAKREFDARITDQVPDERVAWSTVESSDIRQAGVVAFDAVDDQHTDVSLTLDYDPQGIVESVGDRTGFIHKQIKDDLVRFKHFIEERGSETGAWRGRV